MIATRCGTRTVICVRNGQKPERCGSTLMTVTNRPSNQAPFLCYCKADDVCVQFCTFGCDVCICSGAPSLYTLDILNHHSHHTLSLSPPPTARDLSPRYPPPDCTLYLPPADGNRDKDRDGDS